jgi:hypothetical protein
MNPSEINIEDIVVENESVWSQVCEECAKKLDFKNCNEQIPLDKYTCGVENCQNIAVYYLELEKEIINESKL